MKKKALIATLGWLVVLAPACGARTGIPSDSLENGSSADAQPNAACEGGFLRQEVGVATGQVDVVWGVDTSGSMLEESQAVRENINAFSEQIVAAKIDMHVVMLATYPVCFANQPTVCTPGVCVGAPLGSGQCPGDSKPPNFFHHPEAEVSSNDGAVVFVNRFPDYRHMLRPNSIKYLVIVTDDDSTGRPTGPAGAYADNPDRFIADYTALDPMMRSASGAPAWKMSGMYAHTVCVNAAAVGRFWKSVIDKTGGVHGDICRCPAGEQATCAQAFKVLFESLAATIVTAAKPLECEYAIPPEPEGQTFDWTKVDLELRSNGTTETIGWVSDASGAIPIWAAGTMTTMTLRRGFSPVPRAVKRSWPPPVEASPPRSAALENRFRAQSRRQIVRLQRPAVCSVRQPSTRRDLDPAKIVATRVQRRDSRTSSVGEPRRWSARPS